MSDVNIDFAAQALHLKMQRDEARNLLKDIAKALDGKKLKNLTRREKEIFELLNHNGLLLLTVNQASKRLQYDEGYAWPE